MYELPAAPILISVLKNKGVHAMYIDSPSNDFVSLLNAAQNMQIIDTWKVLGPVFMVCRRGSNFYVKPDALESLLKNLCADC